MYKLRQYYRIKELTKHIFLDKEFENEADAILFLNTEILEELEEKESDQILDKRYQITRVFKFELKY